MLGYRDRLPPQNRHHSMLEADERTKKQIDLVKRQDGGVCAPKLSKPGILVFSQGTLRLSFRTFV